jgi:NTP pyrophosphatase (non-canonical NTP hydrolase)
MDQKKTVGELKDIVQYFCEERDWDQFHNPKDLAIGISTEANELLDIFRFKTDEQMKQIFLDTQRREHVEEEIADTLFFILRFAQMNRIDLSKAIVDKIEKNSKKYPVEEAKGKNNKYNER